VAVQFPENLVNLAASSVGVDVDEPEVFDDVGFNHRGVTAEQVLEGGRGRSFRQVAHEELRGGLSWPPRLALFHLDVAAFNHGAV